MLFLLGQRGARYKVELSKNVIFRQLDSTRQASSKEGCKCEAT